jgi:hypothetical protein
MLEDVIFLSGSIAMLEDVIFLSKSASRWGAAKQC